MVIDWEKFTLYFFQCLWDKRFLKALENLIDKYYRFYNSL